MPVVRLTLPADIHARLEAQCARLGTPRAHLMRQAVVSWLEIQEGRAAEPRRFLEILKDAERVLGEIRLEGE